MNTLPLISQKGVHHKVFGREGTHNAIWDFKKSPDNKIYFSLCSELIESSFARLYEYNLENDSFELLFNLEDVVICPYRTIRPSKIHTSISFLPNGNLLMSTHTTDKSPEHPFWMHEPYYAHPWEGYSGSHIIEYNPTTKKAFSHGIPVPYESIYGGVYVRKRNTFYFLGYTKGHLYSYNLDTHKVTDYGQVVEFGTFLIHKGPDEKLYFAGRSGYLARFNVETEQVEQLGVRFDPRPNKLDSHKNMRMDYAVNMDNGLMLLTVVHNDYVYLFDTKTDTLKNIGSFGIEQLPDDPQRSFSNLFTPVLDKENVLWYTVASAYPTDLHTVTLGRWDFLNGKSPEILCTLGSTETGRISSQTSEACIIDDTLYIADTNHANDLPGVFAINLSEFRPYMYENSGYSSDTYINLKEEQYVAFDEYMKSMGKFSSENPFCVSCKEKIISRLWTEIKPESSAVKRIKLTENGACGTCGNEAEEYFFNVTEDKTVIKPVSEMTDTEKEYLTPTQKAFVGNHIPELNCLGRNYKAIITSSAQLANGKFIVGTADGVLGIIDGDKTYRLGRVGNNGPVIDMCSNKNGTVVYGIMGDKDDLGLVFKYTEEKGVEELGILRFADGTAPGVVSSCSPSCCDLSDDGKTLAIGVADRLGCVYILKF